MLRSALALAGLLVALPLFAQPARETLLADPRFDDEDVRPAFATLTAAQVEKQTSVSILEIDDGIQIVQAVEVSFPKGDNVHYATVEFEPPSVRDAGGAIVAIERQSGFLNPTRSSVEHRLLVPGSGEAVAFATVKGRVSLQLPLTVETRTIVARDAGALAKLGAVIDGPFVRYRRDDVGRSDWLDGVDAVRAWNAAGKRLEREGTYPDEVNGDGFEMVAFYGVPARVEIDLPGPSASLAVDYDLTFGNPRATKVAKRLVESADERESDAAASASAGSPADLAGMGHPSIDADQLLGAAGSGDAKAVRLLLAAGVAPNARGTSGMTALHVATAVSKDEVVDLLLEAGADPNATDGNGLTPLFGLAAQCDQTPAIAKLIARGADVNAHGTSPVTPLALAKAMNCGETVSALTKAGAK